MSNFVKADFELNNVFHNIMNENSKSGTYYKTIFHLHTPASHDYKLLNSTKYNYYYSQCSEEEMLEVALKQMPYLSKFGFDFENNQEIQLFDSKKELLAYLLISKKLSDEEIEIVVIADHNNINGYEKLKQAIALYNETVKPKIYTEVILGIEISCADKNHVVGIFNNSQQNIFSDINAWLDEIIMSDIDGTYLTSIDVINKINELNGISYIAHFDNSDFFKDASFLNSAYKKRLFNMNNLYAIGLANRENTDNISKRIKCYTHRSFCFIVDEDSHSLDEIGTNHLWLKGNKRNFNMIYNCLKDFGISVELSELKIPYKYIKGIVIKNHGNGFLIGNNSADFCLSFSEYLNCFIGGRGTGKSTLIKLIEYAINQKVKNEQDLEQICKYSSIWILFCLNNKDYMLQVHNPQKTYEDDNILSLFDNYYSHNHKYIFDNDRIKKIMLDKYIKVYELKLSKGSLLKKAVKNKQEYLNQVFNTSYSINELVETTNGDMIHDYIFKTLFKNTTLSSSKIKVRSANGLKCFLTNINDIKSAREKEVNQVIVPFNEKQKNILRIVYRQSDTNSNTINVRKLLSKNTRISNKLHFNNINISTENIADYIESIFDNYGIEEGLLILLNKNIDKLFTKMSIDNYLEVENIKLIDSGIYFIKNDTEKKNLISDIIDIFLKDNITDIIKSLENYIQDIETFDLEFNINNKELIDSPVIFKNIRNLSLGQKVVAMLSFILGYSEYSGDYSPLIIDQPEDNLDNQYIYKNLVQKLKEMRTKRQVIIATHSSTIVTNAKAEKVIVLDSDNKNGWVLTTGYPNEKNIKRHIINFLEGGVESFRHKEFIYSEITNNDKN